MDIISAIIAMSVTAFLLFRVFFETKDEFITCVKFWFTPDIASILRGEYFDDHWAEFKLWLWIGGSAAMGYGAFSLFH